MSLNNNFPTIDKIIENDGLIIFTKQQRNKIKNFIKICELESFKDTMSFISNKMYTIPTWYYLISDREILNELVKRKDIKKLINLKYNDEINKTNKCLLDNLPNMYYMFGEISNMKLLKDYGLVIDFDIFKGIINQSYIAYQIFKEGILEFDEDKILKHSKAFINFLNKDKDNDNLLTDILFLAESNKDDEKKLMEIYNSMRGFEKLGAKTTIKFKKLRTISEWMYSEEAYYKEIINKYCPELKIIMEKVDLNEKLNNSLQKITINKKNPIKL
jgi:hypothetical protein